MRNADLNVLLESFMEQHEQYQEYIIIEEYILLIIPYYSLRISRVKIFMDFSNFLNCNAGQKFQGQKIFCGYSEIQGYA